ncbi:13E12 repeat family protein, partial [Escherichia coli]|nr:13E12 repeat family protein [Escherichia coli]
VHATVDQLLERPGAGRATCEQTGPISSVVLRRLKADATLQAVLLAPSGAVLRLGRSVRCISHAQRVALLARDGGCVIPGCDVPSAQLEG